MENDAISTDSDERPEQGPLTALQDYFARVFEADMEWRRLYAKRPEQGLQVPEVIGSQQLREELKEVREVNGVEKQEEAIRQAQRGTEERLKQPSLADPAYQKSEQRIAIIEAELLGTRALGGDLKRSIQEPANKMSSSYLGPIIAESETYSIQKLSSTQTVRHAKADLPTVPQVGDDVRINYAADVASVKEEQKLDRSHKHKLSL